MRRRHECCWSVALIVALGCGTSSNRTGRGTAGAASTQSSAGATSQAGSSNSGSGNGSGGAAEMWVPCVPGITELCEGDDGCRGARVCRPDGIGFSACDCGNPSGGVGGAAGSTGGTTNGGQSSGGAANAGTANGGAGNGGVAGSSGAAGSAGAGGEGTMRIPRTCTFGCTTTQDCVDNVAPGWGDNYECIEGACVFLGCLSDLDCVDQTTATDAVCRPYPAWGYDYCTTACTVETDCFDPNYPELAEFYDCVDGGCQQQAGCTNDDQCVGSLGEGIPAACGSTNGDIPRCTRTCTVAADCSQGFATADTDNYLCENNLCAWLGCTSGEECSAVLATYTQCY